MKQQIRRNIVLMLAAAGMVIIPTKAMAHQVQTSYILNQATSSQPNETLELRSTMGSTEPLKGAKVTVFAPDQSFRPYATGVTDSQGRFSFQPNEAITGDWEISIKRAGHADIIRVPVTEEGIDEDSVAQGAGIEDVHYAGSPLMALGGIVVAAACIGFAKVGRKFAD